MSRCRSSGLWVGFAAVVVLASAGSSTAGWTFRGLGSLVDGGISDAFAVSGDGQVVVGAAENDAGDNEAMRWTVADGMVGLGVLAFGSGGRTIQNKTHTFRTRFT